MLITDKVVEVLAWPAVVTGLGLTGLVMFRAQVRQFLARTQSVGKGWLVAAPPSQQALGPGQNDSLQEFLDSYSGDLLLDQEKVIRDDLAARKLETPSERERALIRSLAATHIALHFEQTHSLIWDGQLQLLETLNTLPEGTEVERIKAVYVTEFQQKRAYYQDIDFNTYTAWLVSKLLIRFDSGKIAITVSGREFLKWMVENGKSRRGVG